MLFAAAGAEAVATTAPQATRALIEEIGGLSVASLLILLVFMLIRGTFRLDREVKDAQRERDEWRRLWDQERASHRND